MKTTTFALSILFIGVVETTANAQQPSTTRRSVQSRETATGHKVGTLRAGKLSRGAAVAAPQASAPPPAPGVVQVHAVQGNVFATFIATSLLRSGTVFGGSVSSDNGTAISFDNVSFNSDLNPGDYVQLPQFSNVGDLFPQGTITYTLDVTVGKQLTESNGQIYLVSPPAYSDLTSITPVISTTVQSVGANKNMILAIKGLFKGLFTADTPLVVLGSYDYGNFPVPATAITSVTSTEIDVDLSQITGLDLSTLNEYLLTVSQAGFGDTIAYRYVPFAPKTFNLAPQ